MAAGPDSTRDNPKGARGAGRWLPDQSSLEGWLDELAQRVEQRPKSAPLHPAVEEFRRLIDGDPVVRLLVTGMVGEVPAAERYSKRFLRDVDHLLRMIDTVLGMAPDYNETGLVGAPLSAVLDWCMRTPTGFAAFRHESINAALRNILRAWCDFLSGPDSRYVLTDAPRGWLSAAARAAVGIEQFEYDPGAPYGGFASWNSFFTRRLKSGQRPVADPDDDRVVVSACEATPYAIGVDVQRHDRFWVKAQPYSLLDMLAGDESAGGFVGGTVYQAYLDVHNYHRWHSPVAGTVRRAFVRDGTYFSEGDAEGETAWQGYLAHVATRAVLLIDADDPAVGLVAATFVGMGEVSSCVFGPEVRPGRRLRKGDEVGYFQYGGSTWCLALRPGAVGAFDAAVMPDPHAGRAALVRVGARLATAAARG